MRRVQFGEVKGRVLELTIDDKRSKKGGTEMTFAKFVGKEVSLAVLTKYEVRPPCTSSTKMRWRNSVWSL